MSKRPICKVILVGHVAEAYRNEQGLAVVSVLVPQGTPPVPMEFDVTFQRPRSGPPVTEEDKQLTRVHGGLDLIQPGHRVYIRGTLDIHNARLRVLGHELVWLSDGRPAKVGT